MDMDIYTILLYNKYNKILIKDDIRITYSIKMRKSAVKFINAAIVSMGQLRMEGRVLNTEDFYTGKPVHLIPKIFLFTFRQGLRDVITCDIRSLYDYSGDLLSNPFTSIPIHQEDQDRYQRKLRWLTKYGWSTSHTPDKIRQTDIEQFTINVFSELSQYHYVDYQWFLQLTMVKLKQLYFLLHELWSYRLELSEVDKIDIIGTSTVFTNNSNVKFYTEDMQDTLRTELLHNVQKLISGRKPKDGGLYFLLALVIVSPGAAETYPALYDASMY